MDQKFYPEHREKRFASKRAFKIWLNNTATHRIHFKDEGQDCLIWWIDGGGEVLHSELQPSVWNGMVVDLYRLKVGNEIGVMDSDNMRTAFYDFVVRKIENLTPQRLSGHREVNGSK